MHQMHERRWCIRQPERQHQELEVTVTTSKRRLRYILVRDANLMVTGTKIDLAEYSRTVKSIEEFVDTRQRITVLDGDLVQRAIIDTHAHGTVLLLDEQYRSAER